MRQLTPLPHTTNRNSANRVWASSRVVAVLGTPTRTLKREETRANARRWRRKTASHLNWACRFGNKGLRHTWQSFEQRRWMEALVKRAGGWAGQGTCMTLSSALMKDI